MVNIISISRYFQSLAKFIKINGSFTDHSFDILFEFSNPYSVDGLISKLMLMLQLSQHQDLSFIDSLFSEFIFTLLFAPSLPVIFDSVGNYISYLNDDLIEEARNFKLKILFCSDYMIEEKVTKTLDHSSDQLIFLNDLNNYSKQIMGKV